LGYFVFLQKVSFQIKAM